MSRRPIAAAEKSGRGHAVASTLFAILVGALPAAVWAEDGTDAPLPPSLADLDARPAIPFDPFPMVDPLTGETVGPDAVLDLPTGKSTAGEYYARINDYQRQLNERGYSLKSKADLGVIQRISLDSKQVASQAAMLDETHMLFDGLAMVPEEGHAAALARLKADIADRKQRALQELYERAAASNITIPQVTIPSVDPRMERDANTKLFDVSHREWAFQMGDPAKIAAHGDALYHVGMGASGGEILVSGRFGGSLLGQSADFVYAHGDLTLGNRVDSVSTEDKQGTERTYVARIKANIFVEVVGYERFQWPDRGDATLDTYRVALPTAPWLDKIMGDGPKKDGTGAPGGSATASSNATAGLAPSAGSTSSPADAPAPPSLSSPRDAQDECDTSGGKEAAPTCAFTTQKSVGKDALSYSIHTEKKWYFLVGPIPLSAAIGATGEVSAGWQAHFSGLSLGASAVARAKTAVWAEGGVDVVVASAGIKAEMDLLSDTLSLNGSAELALKDRKPRVDVKLNGTNEISALRGGVQAFASAYVPAAAIPPWEQKTWTYELARWPGYDRTGVLFNFEKEVGSLGTQLKGTPSAEDVGSVQLDDRLRDLFTHVAVDLTGPGAQAPSDARDAMAALAATRASYDAFVKGL